MLSPHPRPRLKLLDKVFWVAARQVWCDWKQSLLIVLPETVVQWHRAGFKLYWRVLSRVWRPHSGRHRISKEIRDLIFQMVAENSTWGAPRIHGELLMLGFDVPSERFRVGCAKRREIPNLRNAGSRFCAIIEKPSPPWTSSQFQRSLSVSSTAFSSSAMIVAACCTLMSLGIRRAIGSFSSSGRHSHTILLPSFSSLTEILNMA